MASAFYNNVRKNCRLLPDAGLQSFRRANSILCCRDQQNRKITLGKITLDPRSQENESIQLIRMFPAVIHCCGAAHRMPAKVPSGNIRIRCDHRIRRIFIQHRKIQRHVNKHTHIPSSLKACPAPLQPAINCLFTSAVSPVICC